MKRKLFFFGRFPAYKEVGGVTTFTYNFSSRFFVEKQNMKVVDFYPSNGKQVPNGVDWELIDGGIITRLLKIFVFCFKNNGSYIFNYSSIRSLFLLFFIPKNSKTKWMTIFHNGEQEITYKKMSFIKKFIIRKALSKVDIVGYLSDKQHVFLKGITTSELCRVSPYIPKNEAKLQNKSLKRKGNHAKNILISGFPTKIYRLLETISLLERLWLEGYEFNLNVCLYGFDNEGIQREICSKLDLLPRAFLYQHLDKNEFNSLLDSTDVYLRLNSVDSFGLVVAEAIDKGILVIATDVCERYPGSLLVKKDDYESVYKELKLYMNTGSLSGSLIVQSAPDNIVSYEDLLTTLQCY